MINLGEKSHFPPLHQSTSNIDDDEIDLKILWQTLLRRKTTILVVTLLGLFLAIMLNMLTPTIYESKTTLHINPAKSYTPNLAGSSLAPNDYIQTQLQYLKSPELSQQLITQLKLSQTYSSNLTSQKLVKKISDSISTKTIKKSQIIHLSFKHQDPLLAQTVTKTIVQSLIDISKTNTSKSLDYAHNYWQEQLLTLTNTTKAAKAAIENSQSADERLSLTSAYLRYQGQLEAAQSKLKNIAILRKANSNFTVITHANLPKEPSSPNLKLNIALGLVLGLFIGILSAFIRDFLDKRIKVESEFLQISSLQILGHIKASNENEAYRSLRTTLMLQRSQAPRPLQSICISHTTPEGQPSICTELAKTFANAKKTVLLIDTHIAQPILHTLFEMNNQEGLSNWLLSPHDPDNKTYIQATSYENISLLSAGTHTGAAELLNSDNLQKLLSNVSKNFDTIIINTAPLCQTSDALIAAYCADTTLISVQLNETEKAVFTQGVEQLYKANANMLGVILS